MKSSALFLMLTLVSVVSAREKPPKPTPLERYLARIQASAPSSRPLLPAPGSLWVEGGLLTDLASDHKARSLGDLITVQIVENLSSESSASVDSKRTLDAESGINALAGKVDTSGITSLFSPHSAQTLKGQGQTASTSKLRTALTGRVVALLPGGALVVQAERELLMNNERQRVLLRGVGRAADVTPEDTIMSTQLSDLEIEVVGKGIVSDSTRPPNFLVRWVLRLLGF